MKSVGAAKLSTLSARDRAYQLIQQKIVAGELTGGSRVSEVALAKELGSSRTPIREAIALLVSGGVLEQTSHKGTIVTDLTRQDIIELYELREALEVYAVGKVAHNSIAGADRDRLAGFVEEIRLLREELITSGHSTLNSHQMKVFMAADFSYHTLLLRLAENRRILKVVRDTRLLIRIFSLRRQGHNAAQLEQIHRFHKEILDLVLQKNAVTATSALAEHIRLSQRERLEEFDHWERESSLTESLPTYMDLPLIDR